MGPCKIKKPVCQSIRLEWREQTEKDGNEGREGKTFFLLIMAPVDEFTSIGNLSVFSLFRRRARKYHRQSASSFLPELVMYLSGAINIIRSKLHLIFSMLFYYPPNGVLPVQQPATCLSHLPWRRMGPQSSSAFIIRSHHPQSPHSTQTGTLPRFLTPHGVCLCTQKAPALARAMAKLYIISQVLCGTSPALLMPKKGT